MLQPTLTQIWVKLNKIEKMLELAELRQMMDNDFRSVGHLMPTTVKAIKDSGHARALGQYQKMAKL